MDPRLKHPPDFSVSDRLSRGRTSATRKAAAGSWRGWGPTGGTLAICVLGLLGCGRPATEEDCTVILRRAARLELESRLDQSEGLVQTEIKQLEETMRPQMMKKCVGKRITDSAMACVKEAKSSEQFDQCLR